MIFISLISTLSCLYQFCLFVLKYINSTILMQLQTQEHNIKQQSTTLEMFNYPIVKQNEITAFKNNNDYNIQVIDPHEHQLPFRCEMIVQIVRILLYSLSVILLFMLVYYPKIQFTRKVSVVDQLYSVEMQNIQIIVDKNMIGVYPSVNGTVSSLYNKWKLTQDSKFSINNGYSIQLKKNNVAWITRNGCQGQVKAIWKISFYNIFIDIVRPQQQPDQYTLEVDRQDYSCINGNQIFFNELESVTIWSVDSKNLYLLYEENINNTTQSKSTQNKIFIFVPQDIRTL